MAIVRADSSDSRGRLSLQLKISRGSDNFHFCKASERKNSLLLREKGDHEVVDEESLSLNRYYLIIIRKLRHLIRHLLLFPKILFTQNRANATFPRWGRLG